MQKLVGGVEWFTGPGMRHPLAEPETARKLIAKQTVGGDAATVLRRLTEMIDELDRLPDVSLNARFEVLDLLDGHAKHHQIALVPEYLETARLRKLSEGVLWKTSFDFWKVIGDAYLHCLYRYLTLVEPPLEFEDRLPILVGRILRSLALQLKWTTLRHGRVEESLWKDLGRTYLFAESRNFSSRRVAVYPSRHGESSAREELLKVLMFTVAAPDALTPVQQHIVERIVAHFGSRFEISTQPSRLCAFAFDLATGKPPTRGWKGAPAALLVRHFGPGEAVDGLNDLRTYLSRSGSLPPFINVGGSFPREQVDSALLHLARCWSEQPPTRAAARATDDSRMTVVPGLAENVRWLSDVLDAGRLDVVPPESAVSWQTSDASAGGCGARCAGSLPDWVAIGALLGLLDERKTVCRMGIVRRIIDEGGGDGEATEQNEQHRIGLQLIGDAAAPVALFPAAATHSADPARAGEGAILLSSRPDGDGNIELLVRRDGVSAGKAMQLRFLGRVYRLETVRVIEHGQGYRWISCKLLGAA